MLFVLIIAAVFLSATQRALADDPSRKRIVLVDQREAKAVIIVADDASAQIKTAAAELSKYIRLSTSVDLRVGKYMDMKAYQGHTRIIIRTLAPPNDDKSSLFADRDGFSILFPDNNTIVVSGSTDLGTQFGVYEFLERYIGVRWLMPGASGEFVPANQKLSLPVRNIKGSPAFASRLLSGLKGSEQYYWALHNRMHGQIKFHHNLFELFPPERYTKKHPEFYPVIKGKRYLSEDGAEHGWQPCFLAPGLVDEAVKNICDYFAKHPEEMSYSLGVNDSGGHCECDVCRAKTGGLKNYLGLRHMSDPYFEWANAVVEGVLKTYPDKWFGMLAYSELAEPPSREKVHPRIIPFMTYDRMKWVAPSFEKNGKALTEQWRAKSPVLGWYDYIYGTPYLVPRIYFHKMADYYKWGYEHGVRAMYAEAYPNWGEGPKLYLAMKLQWNPYLDVDALLLEWYEACVGKKAAPHLKAYYDLWENYWTKKAPKTKWFAKGGQYLRFDEAGYLDLIDDEMVKSRRLLSNVVRLAQTVEQRKRANLMMKAFEYYEASVISYSLRDKCSGVMAWLPGKDCEVFRAMKGKRLKLVNAYEQDPLLVHPLRFDQRNILQW